MTREDINDIINAICPNDEDYEKSCISPKYLRQELEQLSLDQKQWIGEPTTKNDFAHERYQDLIEYFGDEKVAKNILENRKEFRAWLERLRWNVKRVDELASELEQIKSTTKNNLGVDAVSRKAVKEVLYAPKKAILTFEEFEKAIDNLPSVTPQEPQSFKWCTDCKEYDTEKHCCHRYSKVIRDTVAEIRQESILDKIRAEIEVKLAEPQYQHEEEDWRDGLIIAETIIDKYKAENEADKENTDGN